MSRTFLLCVSSIAFVVSGCIAKTALDVATAPVRAASQAADWATTSQDEADRARGRDVRRREERLGELHQKYEELADECAAGDNSACRKAVALRREMDELSHTLPVEST